MTNEMPGVREPTVEEYSNLVQLLSLVDESVKAVYPTLSGITANQVKIVPTENFHSVVSTRTKSILHPEFLKLITQAIMRNSGHEPRFIPQEADQWSDWITGDCYIDEEKVAELATDPILPFTQGLNFIGTSIRANTQPQIIDAPQAQELAHAIVDSNFADAYNFNDDEKRQMHETLKKRGAKIWTKGGLFAIQVDGAIYGSAMHQQTDEAINDYLARPVLQDFAERIIVQQNVPEADKERYRRTARLVGSMLFPFPQNKEMEEQVPAFLATMGIGGTTNILSAYLGSSIWKSKILG